MTKSVRAELDQIEKFLLKGGQPAIDLWAILSALRGPDNADIGLKASTTEPIRTKAFPVLAQEGSNVPATFAPRKKMIDTRHPRAGAHFISHVERAAAAIARKN